MGNKDFVKLLDERLKQHLLRRQEQASNFDSVYEELWQEIGRLSLRGGKRLRPYIAYTAYDGYGGQDEDMILDLCSAVEFFHLFLLIHDDIIDRDWLRYGGPNLAGAYRDSLPAELADREHFASAAALLAGDACYQLCLEILLNFEAPLNGRLAACINQVLNEVIGGEMLDVAATWPQTGQLDRARLEKLDTAKTTSYSVRLPLRLGAMAAGMEDERELDVLDEFAGHLGMAYQLRDDWLGIFGNESLLGKSGLSDMQEGKQTLLVWHVYKHGGSELTELQQIYGHKEAAYSDLERVRQIFKRAGADAALRQVMSAETKAAEAALRKSRLKDPGVTNLISLAAGIADLPETS